MVPKVIVDSQRVKTLCARNYAKCKGILPIPLRQAFGFFLTFVWTQRHLASYLSPKLRFSLFQPVQRCLESSLAPRTWPIAYCWVHLPKQRRPKHAAYTRWRHSHKSMAIVSTVCTLNNTLSSKAKVMQTLPISSFYANYAFVIPFGFWPSPSRRWHIHLSPRWHEFLLSI